MKTTSKVGLVVVALLLAIGAISALNWYEQRGDETTARSAESLDASGGPVEVDRQDADESNPTPAEVEAPSPTHAPDEWSEGTIRGRVGRDDQQVPAGTKLILIGSTYGANSRKVRREAVAATDGTYSFGELPVGGYALYSIAPGYAPWWDGYHYVVDREGNRTVEITPHLVPGTTYRMTFRDSAGQGHAGMAVEIRAGRGRGPVEVTRRGTTDERGIVELRHLPEGRAEVRFTLSDGAQQEWQEAFQRSDFIDRVSIVERVVVVDAILEGSVRDPEGRPLAGMEVRIGRRWGFAARARTDDAGRYRVRGIAPGEYGFLAKREGTAVLGGPVRLAGEPHSRFDVTCDPGALLGRVERAKGSEADAGLTLSGARFVILPLGKRGEFAFWNLPAGSYTLSGWLAKSGTNNPTTKIELAAGEIRSDVVLAFRKKQYGEVELEIRAKDGTLVESAQFFVEVPHGSTSMAPRPHAPGRFKLKREAGRWKIKIRCGAQGSADLVMDFEPGRTVFETVQLK